MKVKVSERPKVFDAEQFTALHVLDPKNNPLPEGVSKKGTVEIFPEDIYDKGEPTGKKRKPEERIGQHTHFLRLADGTQRRVSVGDWILTDGAGNKRLVFKDNFDAFEAVDAPKVEAAAAKPAKKSEAPAKG